MCNNHACVQVTTDTPMFEHDCNTCVFLGRYEGPAYGKVDLYAHVAGTMPTLLARWSSHGQDYASGLDFGYGVLEELTEARKRAQAAGLLEYEVYRAVRYAPKGSGSHDEMRKALPFTEEYQAYLAFRNGDVARSQGLLIHLMQLQHGRMAAPEGAIPPTADDVLEAVTGNLARILEASEEDRAFWLTSAQMTEFLLGGKGVCASGAYLGH